MGKTRKRPGIVVLATAAALTTGAAMAQPSKTPRPAPQCFHSSDWNGWKATPDGRSVYISTGVNRVWRFDMAQPCRELNDIQATMVTRTDVPWICRPIDVNMRVLRPGIGITYCQVRKITRLSKDEGRALPRSLRP